MTVPVVLVLFNRPEPLRLVFDRVRTARPPVLLVVADGPRPGHPDDEARCEAARAVVDVDWPCEVLRCEADRNLGCDERLASGLDWAFEQVERAVVLEDDIVPHPAFFGWAETMLHRYDDDPTVMHVSGRNEMGRWGPPGADHLVIRRGSVWGWATWRRAWTTVDRSLGAAADPGTEERLRAIVDEPLVARHVALHLDAARRGALHAWDTTWSLARVLSGGLSIAPPTNLVRNVGFGADATRTTDPGDLRGGLPHVEPAATGADNEPGRPVVDAGYDRAALLVDLMSTYQNPAAARRLARSRDLLDRAGRGLDPLAAHHLTPFDHPAESLAAVRHLRAAGSRSAALDRLESELDALVTSGGAP